MTKARLSIPAIAGLLTAVAAIITAIATFLSLWLKDGVNTVVVPNTEGLTAQAAQTTLQNNRLIPGNIDYRPHDTLAPGIVCDQDPRGGLTVLEKTVVNLIVVKKIETVIMPNMIDQPLDIAKITLLNNHLALGQISNSM